MCSNFLLLSEKQRNLVSSSHIQLLVSYVPSARENVAKATSKRLGAEILLSSQLKPRGRQGRLAGILHICKVDLKYACLALSQRRHYLERPQASVPCHILRNCCMGHDRFRSSWDSPGSQEMEQDSHLRDKSDNPSCHCSLATTFKPGSS